MKRGSVTPAKRCSPKRLETLPSSTLLARTRFYCATQARKYADRDRTAGLIIPNQEVDPFVADAHVDQRDYETVDQHWTLFLVEM